MHKFDLTIAIPTYNRSVKLHENLKNIFEIINSNTEVVVSDNCSTDDTTRVCEHYTDFENFSYRKNNKNLGYDQNVLNCLALSKGRYVWFLSDDDKITADLYFEVIKIIQLKCEGILIDAVVYDENENKILKPTLSPIESDCLVNVDDHIFIKCFKWSTLLSAIVIKKDSVFVNNFEAGVGTCFIQLPMLWLSVWNKNIYLLKSKQLKKIDSSTNFFGSTTSFLWLWQMIKIGETLSKNEISSTTIKSATTSIYERKLFSYSGVVAHYFHSRVFNNELGGLNNYHKVKSSVNLSRSEIIILYWLARLDDQEIARLYKFAKKIRGVLRWK